MKTPNFIDPVLQKQYEDLGYVQIKGVLNESEIQHLNYLFKDHYSYAGQPTTMWNSLCDISISD